MKTLIIDNVEWTVGKVKERIATDDMAAIRALLRIYKAQTPDEQRTLDAKRYNGVGFNKPDAWYGCKMAQIYYRCGSLYPAVITKLKKMMPKYAGQIFNQMVEERKTKVQ